MKAGWTTKRVGEIAQHSLGKMLDKVKNKGTPRPYLRNFNVRWFEFDLSDLLEMPFLPSEIERYTAVKGDVLVCEGGYPGRAAIWERSEPICFQKALHRVRFHEPERSRWFLYYLLSKDLDGTLKNHFNGSGIQHFTGEALARFEVPLPPLPEQRRIVALLDAAFEGLATAAANAERNLQNARDLFESHLAEVFSRRGEGWVERRLDSLCREITVGFVGSMAREYVPSGVTFLRSQNIRPFEISLEGAQFVRQDFHQRLSKSCLRPGDVAVVRTGYPGTAAVIPTSLPEANCADLVIVRPGVDVEPQFLAAFFNSTFGKRHVSGNLVGAAQKHFNVGAAKATVLALPPRPEQRRIIAELFEVRSITSVLSRLFEQKQAALAALKRSLLHQAFNGKL